MRILSAALFFSFCLSVFVSCQKEKSFEVEAPAIGSLKSDNTGDCLPKTAVGAFIAGSALTDSNYLVIEVDISKVGSYAIRTDTANGYSFSGRGNFDKIGINQIRLAASGTPVEAGQDQFTVFFDSSVCFVPVTVLPAGSNSGPAAFTLQGSGDSCMIASVAGTYLQNVALDATNTVSIKVNATTSGIYTVTTNTVNEFSFSGSGTIATPGENTIVLTASGTPATEGSTVFTVTAGNTTCSFSVNVTASDVASPQVGNSTDLFPLSANSKWSYVTEEGETEDTFTVNNTGTAVFAQKTYNHFEYMEFDDLVDEAFYRKEGNNYYEYADVTKYSLIEFEEEQKGEILFLKENLAAGDTWQSADFTGTSEGNEITMHYIFTCNAVNTTAVVNSKTYTGVTKISFTTMAGIQGVFGDTGAHITMYFAKGIGLIYQEAMEYDGATLFIKNYDVK